MKKLASRVVYESIYIIIWEKERNYVENHISSFSIFFMLSKGSDGVRSAQKKEEEPVMQMV